MDLKTILVDKAPAGVEWVEGAMLWDICQFKISGLPIAEQFLVQAQDKDLKMTINMGIDKILIPHIEKLRNFLIKEGLEVPPMPDRKVKGNNTDAFTKSNLINDADIANGLRNVFRLGLNLDIRGITYGTRADINYLFKEILNEDIDGYINITKLILIKNWAVTSPYLPSQPTS